MWSSIAVTSALAAHGYSRLREMDGTDEALTLGMALTSIIVVLLLLNLFWAARSTARNPGERSLATTILSAPLRPESANGPAEEAHSGRYSRWVRTAPPTVYAVALVAPTLLGIVWATLTRSRPRFGAVWLGTQLAFVFALGSFFWPVEFLNSCLADSLFDYTLC